MKRLLLTSLVLATLMAGCQGCSMKSLLNEVPDGEFKNFEYHRAGNGTSAGITASNAAIQDGQLTIEQLSIKADYGPFVNFNIKLEGWKKGDKIGN